MTIIISVVLYVLNVDIIWDLTLVFCETETVFIHKMLYAQMSDCHRHVLAFRWNSFTYRRNSFTIW